MFRDYYNWNFKDRNNKNNGRLYEYWVKVLLWMLGFEAETTGRDNDKGVDIIARTTTDARTKFYIQCKCWSGEVGASPIQEVYAGCVLHGSDGYPVVITNSTVTHGARKIARDLGVEIISEPEWREMQLAYEQNEITNKLRYGLMGIIMASSIMDYEHIKECERNPYLPQKKPTGYITKREQCKLDITQKYDDAVMYEREAAQYEQKASCLRQMSLTLQKEAILKNFDYG